MEYDVHRGDRGHYLESVTAIALGTRPVLSGTFFRFQSRIGDISDAIGDIQNVPQYL